ncbi:hypothetical protein NLU13_1202 [Sarocladium strictum]|uniref:Uncharacterized protein n=1 Tax=Sarocladium strictum TaxID=5046 RepID=A0AA39GQH7_SARSR|nr:hypothetical protein NLU13_1202 [Sarocladium strictum]
MSELSSLFVSDSCDESSDDCGEAKVLHDAFLDRIEHHQSTVKMDFDLWLNQIITLLLNTSGQKEWAVDQFQKVVDIAARKHHSMPTYVKNALVNMNDENSDERDDPNRYELVFTERELKACAGLIDVPFAGSRKKSTRDRLYSLFRHKVLGKEPLKLETALRRRQAEKTKQRQEEEAKARDDAEKAKTSSTEKVLPSIETTPQGSKRLHESSDEEEFDSLDGYEVLGDDEIQTALGHDWLSREEDDILSAGNDDDVEIQNHRSAPKRPKIPVCFRQQTAHDRRKMQPKVSDAERIEKLRRENERLQKEVQKLRIRVEMHKRARATAEIAQQKAEQREAKVMEGVASERSRFNEREAKIRARARALEHDEQNLKSLNSQVTKDFW